MPAETTTHSIDGNVTQQPNNKKNRFPGFLREALAIFFWLYLVTKLFVFDIDIFLIDKLAPNYTWLINYKFFILIGLLAIIFLVTKNKHIFWWSLFVLFYPIILIFWKIPILIFKKKSWNLTFALFDSIISFFKSPKLRFVKTSIFLVSMAIILGSSNNILLWVSLSVITIIILLAYIQRSILIFKPPDVYHFYSKIFSKYGEFLKANPTFVLDENGKNLPIEGMDNTQIEKWTTSIQQLVLFNRVCLFFAKKLKSYKDSKFNIASYVFGIMILILFTVFSFTLINYGLFKVNAHYFSFSNVPTFFNFIYYSFNNLLFNSIPDIVATAPVSQVFSMVESLFALFLIVILVTLVLTVKNQKEVDEMDAVINSLSDEGKKMEDYIKDKYQFNNIDETMQALKKLNAALIDILYQITNSIT
jgi:hypothetical protein